MKHYRTIESNITNTIQAGVYTKRYTSGFDCTIWTSEDYIGQKKV